MEEIIRTQERFQELEKSQEEMRRDQERFQEELRKTEEEIIRTQERFQEELRKTQEEMKRDQERFQEELRKSQEEFRKNQERFEEEMKEGQEKFEEEVRKSKEEIRRIKEEMIRRNRIKANNNEINNMLNQLPVTKIENINKLNDENKKCIICLEDFENDDKIIYLPCFHLFHEKCITDWINMNKGFCPLCRTIINNMI